MSQILDAINKAEEKRNNNEGKSKPEVADKAVMYKHVTTQQPPEKKKSKKLPLLLLTLLAAGGIYYAAYQQGNEKASEPPSLTDEAIVSANSEESVKTSVDATEETEVIDIATDSGSETSNEQTITKAENKGIDSDKPAEDSGKTQANDNTAEVGTVSTRTSSTKEMNATSNVPQIKTIPHPSSKPINTDSPEQLAKTLPITTETEDENKLAEPETVETAEVAETPKVADTTETITEPNSVKAEPENAEVTTKEVVENEPLVELSDKGISAEQSDLKPLRPVVEPLELETTEEEPEIVVIEDDALDPVVTSPKIVAKKKKATPKVKPRSVAKKAQKPKKVAYKPAPTRTSTPAWKKNLSITAIVYDTNPKSRMVLINRQTVREGMKIPGTSLKLVSILARGVIVDDGKGEVFVSSH